MPITVKHGPDPALLGLIASQIGAGEAAARQTGPRLPAGYSGLPVIHGARKKQVAQSASFGKGGQLHKNNPEIIAAQEKQKEAARQKFVKDQADQIAMGLEAERMAEQQAAEAGFPDPKGQQPPPTATEQSQFENAAEGLSAAFQELEDMGVEMEKERRHFDVVLNDPATSLAEKIKSINRLAEVASNKMLTTSKKKKQESAEEIAAKADQMVVDVGSIATDIANQENINESFYANYAGVLDEMEAEANSLPPGKRASAMTKIQNAKRSLQQKRIQQQKDEKAETEKRQKAEETQRKQSLEQDNNARSSFNKMVNNQVDDIIKDKYDDEGSPIAPTAEHKKEAKEMVVSRLKGELASSVGSWLGVQGLPTDQAEGIVEALIDPEADNAPVYSAIAKAMAARGEAPDAKRIVAAYRQMRSLALSYADKSR